MRSVVAICVVLGVVALWLSGCSPFHAKPVSALPDPPIVVPSAIWIEYDEAPDRPVCVRLFEPNSMYLYKCVSVRNLRIWLAGMHVAD